MLPDEVIAAIRTYVGALRGAEFSIGDEMRTVRPWCGRGSTIAASQLSCDVHATARRARYLLYRLNGVAAHLGGLCLLVADVTGGGGRLCGHEAGEQERQGRDSA